MYNYFTVESRLNFKTTETFPHFLKRLDKLGTVAKQIYTFLLEKLAINKFHGSTKTGSIRKRYGMFTVEEGDNIYVEVSREVIAEAFGYSLGTVRKYIKILSQHQLLVDVRIGINQVNKIFLKFPFDAAYTFTKEEKVTESENEQKNNEVEVAPPTPSNTDTYIKVSSIISQLTDDCLSEKDYKNLLNIAKGDTKEEKLEDIQKAVENCYGKTPSQSYVRMVFNTLQKRYHDAPVPQPKEQSQSKKVCSSKKRSFGDGMYTHKWDMDELEDLAAEYWQDERYKD